MRDPMNERGEPLSKPQDGDGVICPDSPSKRILTPTKVYDTTENGKRVRRGTLPEHKHRVPGGGWGYNDCPYEGHPVVVVPKPGISGGQDTER